MLLELLGGIVIGAIMASNMNNKENSSKEKQVAKEQENTPQGISTTSYQSQDTSYDDYYSDYMSDESEIDNCDWGFSRQELAEYYGYQCDDEYSYEQFLDDM